MNSNLDKAIIGLNLVNILTGEFCAFKEAFTYSTLEKIFGINKFIYLYDLSHHATPSGLLTGPQSCAIVAMKVLREKNKITPVRV